jgi:hypothetical protein
MQQVECERCGEMADWPEMFECQGCGRSVCPDCWGDDFCVECEVMESGTVKENG